MDLNHPSYARVCVKLSHGSREEVPLQPPSHVWHASNPPYAVYQPLCII